ncbi:MAG: ribonuclease HII [Kiritimatiellae bacterium]|nr:ribonuclease HII [Kiritimatiellia bacterium]
MNAVSLDFERAFPPGSTVMGIDEAGRGPLAGPVFTAAVSVPLDTATALLNGPWAAINDSKKLSERKRDALADVIKSTPSCTWAVASASALEIDQLNILRATHLAMRRAALALAEKLVVRDSWFVVRGSKGASHEPQNTNREPRTTNHYRILVDGLPVPTLPFPSQNVVKGDAKSLFIAAASILAKTSRDAYCREMETKYPGYGFAVHKGYPTAAHMEALTRLGPCPEHRQSFNPVAEAIFFRGSR